METGDSEEPRLARRGAAFLLSRILRGAGGDVLQVSPAWYDNAILIRNTGCTLCEALSIPAL